MSNIKVKDLPVETNPQITDSTINDSLNVTTKKVSWQDVYNMFVAAGMAVVSSMAGIVATGTNQATAYVLSKINNRVDTVPLGTGVVEPTASAANVTHRTIQNRCGTGHDLNYYPFLGDHFYGQSANVPLVIADGNQVSVVCYTNGELTTI